MIKEDAAPEARRRMDVGLENLRAAALQVEREVDAAPTPQPMRQPMAFDRVKSLEIEERLDQTATSRIALDNGGEIGAKVLDNRGLRRDRGFECVGDHFGGHGRRAKLGADAADNRLGETRSV